MTRADVRQRAGMARESLQVALERLELVRDESEPSAEAQVAASNASAADRWLWSAGVRPVTISTYCVGLVCLCPELPANTWHRTLRTYFGR